LAIFTVSSDLALLAASAHAAGLLLDGIHEFRHVWHVRLVPVPLEHPGADARLGRQAFQRFQLLLAAGEVEALVQAELHRLLQRVDHVVALHEEQDHVGLGRLCLDQVRGEVGRAQRR
jgi:hypothetical protein